MNKTRNTLFFLFILFFVVFLSITRVYEPSSFCLNSSSSLGQDIVFNYNYTSNKEFFIVELPSLELNNFNSLTLFFTVYGYSSSSGSLKVTFIFNETEIVFNIDQVFQDAFEYNLSQIFTFPEHFNGAMNVTIICEGHTSYSYQSGSLHISSLTKVEVITPPTLFENSSYLPIIPYWLKFKGSTNSKVTRSIQTYFYVLKGYEKLNSSLSFVSNDFTAFSKYIEIEVNGEIVLCYDFQENKKSVETFLLPVIIGLNSLSVHFSLEYGLGVVLISDIQLFGNVLCFQDILPDDVYDWVSWESSYFEHSFNLSPFKPTAVISDQVLHFTLEYVFFGAAVSPFIQFELKSGMNIIHSGEISEDEQFLQNTLEIDSFTTTYHDDLIFRISGTAETAGMFYILNSSKLEIEPVPQLRDNTSIVRELVSEESYVTPDDDSLVVIFSDIFYVDSTYLRFNTTLSFNLFDEEYSAVNQIDVQMRFDHYNVIDATFNNEKVFHETTQISLLRGFYDVKVTLSILGNGLTVFLHNLEYSLSSLENSQSNTDPFDNPSYTNPFTNSSIDDKVNLLLAPKRKVILGIEYGLDCFAIVVFFALCYLKKCKQRKETEESSEEFEIQITGFRSRMSKFSNIGSSVKQWSLKIWDSTTRTVLLPLAIAYIPGKIYVIRSFTEEIIVLAEKGYEHAIFASGANWYNSLIFSLYFSTIIWLCVLILLTNFVFYQDLYGFTKIFGGLTSIWLSVSWIGTSAYIKLNNKSFDVFTPILFLGVFLSLYGLSIVLGKIEKRRRNLVMEKFFRTGRLTVKSVSSEDSKTKITTTEEELSDEEKTRLKRKLLNIIIVDINPNLPVSSKRLAEILEAPIELTEKFLQEITNQYPAIGKYYPIEQIYVKKEYKSEEYLDLRNKEAVKEVRDLGKTEAQQSISLTKTSATIRFQEMYEDIEGEDDKQKKKNLMLKLELTPKEATVYLSFIKKGAGEEDIELVSNDLEFLQKALKKMDKREDIFQRNTPENLVKDIYDGLEVLHGFDDVVLFKRGDKYEVIFIEYKGGDYVATHPWDYIPKTNYHLRRITLNLKQIIILSKNLKIKDVLKTSKKRKLGKNMLYSFFVKLFYDRNRQYHGIGNDWLIKLKNGDFKTALNKLIKRRFMTYRLVKTFLKGLIEQNEIIGLAQNGHVIKLSKNTNDIIDIVDYTEITFNNNKIIFTDDFFSPKFKKKGQQNYFTLKGFTDVLDDNRKLIQSLIPYEMLEPNFSEEYILLLYAKIKRLFLFSLFNTKKLDYLQKLVGGRAFYGLETMVSLKLENRIEEWFDNYKKRRGVCWFYDYGQHRVIDFMHPKDFRKLFQKAIEETLFGQITSMLIDPQYFFESQEEEYFFAKESYKEFPFKFFLFDNNNNNKFPPRFNFWDHKKPPSLGIVLVNEDGDFYSHKPATGGLISPKVAGIKLESHEKLLNFPVRWDNSADGFIFGRHSKDTSMFTETGLAWSSWLKSEKLVLPTGPSAKIPDESVTVMLLEWIKGLTLFVQKRILKHQKFVDFCAKNNLEVAADSCTLRTPEGSIYSIAKVSMDKGGRLRHLEDWKYFSGDNLVFLHKMQRIIKSMICDIALKEREINPKTIDNWEKWVEKNWPEEFKSIKKYFLRK